MGLRAALHWMMKDGRNRTVLALATTVMLLYALGSWTSWYRSMPHSYHGCVHQPQACEGRRFVSSLYHVVEIEDDRRYVIEQAGRQVRVKGRATEREIGEEITVVGTFLAEEQRLLAEIEKPALKGPSKRGLGLVGAMFVLGILPVWFRVREGRVELRA